MKRTFFHMDEFGGRGASYLPHCICISDPLVVWGPTAQLFTSTVEAFMTPKDLLSLVDQENAPVRIAGRREWLFDEAYRNNHPWEKARWSAEFDKVVRRFAMEDESRPLMNRRVIVAEAEEGFEKASEFLGTPNGRRISRRLETLHREQFLPAGMLEKANRAAEKKASVSQAILRDLYNHNHALASTGAGAAIAPSEHMAVLNGLLPDHFVPRDAVVGPLGTAGHGLVTAEDLRDASHVLTTIKPVMNMKELRNFLRSGQKNELHELMYSPRSTKTLEAHLAMRIRESILKGSFIERYFKSDDPVQLTISVGAIAVAIASIMLTKNIDFGLVPIAFEAAAGQLRKHSMIPEAILTKHPAGSLFRFAYGSNRPTRKQIESLLDSLASIQHP